MRSYTSHADIEFDDIEIDGLLYTIQAEASGKWGEMGIGPYEFWGMHGYDSHPGIEEFDLDDVLVQQISDDGDAREITDKTIVSKVIDWVYNNKVEEVIEQLEEDRGEDEYEG